MSPSLWAFVAVGAVVLVYVLFAPQILPKRTVGAGRGRGGVMDTIARWVVLGLGRLTYWTLRGFEKLGVDMARIEDELARLNRNVSAKLADAAAAVERAQAEVQRVKDEDAAEDAVQISTAVDRALAEAADKIKEAADAVGDPAATDPSVDPLPPVAEEPVPPVDPGPTDPVSPVDPVTPTNPEDPSTPPADAPDVEPENTPVVDEPTQDGGNGGTLNDGEAR